MSIKDRTMAIVEANERNAQLRKEERSKSIEVVSRVLERVGCNDWMMNEGGTGVTHLVKNFPVKGVTTTILSKRPTDFRVTIYDEVKAYATVFADSEGRLTEVMKLLFPLYTMLGE